MKLFKNVLLRILATFVVTGLGVIGAGTIAGVSIQKAIFMAGIGGVANVLEGLARAFLTDGNLSEDEVNAVFSKIEQDTPAHQ